MWPVDEPMGIRRGVYTWRVKALSIRQPWAYLIVHGFKDIENRNWRTAFRGRVYIHAGQKFDTAQGFRAAFFTLQRQLGKHRAGEEWQEMWRNSKSAAGSWPGGVIVGGVDIIGCVSESTSPWFAGPWGFVLASPIAYGEPIPCRGRPGLFEGVKTW